MRKPLKFILVGGGTGGGVAPLLAVASGLKAKYPTADFLFLGTRSGPERAMVKALGLTYQPICAGKWRRYFSGWNLLTPGQVILGFIQAWYYLLRYRPQLVLTAGSFSAVPVAWAAWCLRLPVWVHQQDIKKGLANSLMAPVATVITTTLAQSVPDFPPAKTVWTGNPIRAAVLAGDKQRAISRFKLEKDWPTVLVLGGGTGSRKINQLVTAALPRLVKVGQIIHLIGEAKFAAAASLPAQPRYHPYPFLTAEDLGLAYAAASVVLSRAGLSTLSELATLGKATILIPLPHSHQEQNAEFFQPRGGAIVLPESDLTPESLISTITSLLASPQQQKQLADKIITLMKHHGTENVIKEIEQVLISRQAL